MSEATKAVITSTCPSKFSVLLQKVFLSFLLHLCWIGVVVYLNSNVTGGDSNCKRS